MWKDRIGGDKKNKTLISAMILTLFGPSVADWSGTEESNWLQTAWGSTLFSFFYFHFFFLPPLGDRPYVRLIHICKQLLSSSYFTITVLLPNCLFPPHMLFSPQSSAGFLQPPSLTLSPLPPSLSLLFFPPIYENVTSSPSLFESH